MPAKKNILIRIGAFISVIGGVIISLTIIGALIGVPSVIVNWSIFKGYSSNNSWSVGLKRLWQKRDIKLGMILGLITGMLIGGLLIIIGQYLLKK